MTSSPTGRTLLALLVAGALAAAARPAAALATGPATNQNLLDQMAEAKAETDLGRYDAAIRALSAIIVAPDAAPALRDEALIRLVFSGHGRTLGERHLARISQARGNRGAEGGI